MLHCVVETPDYPRDADQAGLTADERARKPRFAGRGKGKSGGYRVITFFAGRDVPVFLLNVFAKGDKVDLTKAERNELRQELAGLASDYRLGVRRYVQGW